MKAMIFKDESDLVWLHPKDIIRIHVHSYSMYKETTIHLPNFIIQMNDYHHGDFIEELYRFINSDDNLSVMKVADLDVQKDYAFFRVTDWITQAMG